jgi:hypothetical protein
MLTTTQTDTTEPGSLQKQQLAFLRQERAGSQQQQQQSVIRYGAISLPDQRRRQQRHQRVKMRSVILEERSSQIDLTYSNFPTSVNSSGRFLTAVVVKRR